MNSEYDYCAALDQLRFSPAQRSAIRQRLQNAGDLSRVSRRPLRRAAAAALACVLVLTAAISAGAAGYLDPALQLFESVFRTETPRESELLSRIAYPLGVGSTRNGVTVRAEGILGSEECACILFTVTRDNGERLLPEGQGDVFPELIGTICLADDPDRKLSLGSGTYYPIDDDPDDDTAMIVMAQYFSAPLRGETLKLRFDRLSFREYDPETGKSGVLRDEQGPWTLVLPMEYENISGLSLKCGEKVTEELTATEIRISPVFASVTLETEYLLWLPQGDVLYGMVPPVILHRTDGTDLDLTQVRISWSSESDGNGRDKYVFTIGGLLDRLIPLETVDSIQIGTGTYRLRMDTILD